VRLQAFLDTTILLAGIHFLPFTISTLASAISGGVLLSKTGSYRPLHTAASVLGAISFGMITILTASTWRCAVFQLIESGILGTTQAVMLSAVMTGLLESDVSASAAVYSFIRTFKFIWGAVLPAVILKAIIDRNLTSMSLVVIGGHMVDGAAYSFATRIRALRSTLCDRQWKEMQKLECCLVSWIGR
jgi:hypothetical protein